MKTLIIILTCVALSYSQIDTAYSIKEIRRQSTIKNIAWLQIIAGVGVISMTVYDAHRTIKINNYSFQNDWNIHHSITFTLGLSSIFSGCLAIDIK